MWWSGSSSIPKLASADMRYEGQIVLEMQGDGEAATAAASAVAGGRRRALRRGGETCGGGCGGKVAAKPVKTREAGGQSVRWCS